uniref:Malignant fibrous histiocytoma-amplified sequence 1 n=1 Tax=Petromyzon marinus TaxID=7757 RepID=A0AAJ7SV67_PETMA|nr:malignant fibrous histiocytoma-amplified sequence 1 [Petromyzon marinus]XP_032806156.1 malignant fibrous histiocytoma-amplified sequence 1 [Petromyzon marinus]
MKSAKVWRDAAVRSRKLGPELRRVALGVNGSGRLSLPSVLQLQQEVVDVLDLGNNALEELPDALAQLLAQLQVLVLRRNRLSALPACVLALDQLRELDLSHNRLAALPADLRALRSLQKLCAAHNRLRSLPDSIGELSSLAELDVSFNELETLPRRLGALRRLRALDVDHNRLAAFPEQLLALAELEELDLSGNRIERLPEEGFRGLGSLAVLWLSNAHLSAALPDAFCELHHLENLMMDGNELDALPAAFGRLRRLKILNLSSNRFAEFPAAVTELSSLEELYFSRNLLPAVPESVSLLRKLTVLWLDNNRLRYLPDGLVELGQLEELVLQGNQIAILPDNFGRLANVRVWKIKDNPLIQPPYEVCLKGVPHIAAYQKELSSQRPAARPRLKLVLLGAEGSGKTTLKSCLTESPGDGGDGGEGITASHWETPSDAGTTFVVYDLSGAPHYELMHQFFLSPGALYLLVVDLESYVPAAFDGAVGYFLRLLGGKLPGCVVCLAGTHSDGCSARDLEERCLDIHLRIALQELGDCALLRTCKGAADEAAAAARGERLPDPPAPEFHGVSEMNLGVRSARLGFLLNHRLQILSPVLPVNCRSTQPGGGGPGGVARLRRRLLSVAASADIFPDLHRALPASWPRLEQLLGRADPGPGAPAGPRGDAAVRAALGAGLSEERLRGALAHLHACGRLLHLDGREEEGESGDGGGGGGGGVLLRGPARLLEALNALCERRPAALLRNLRRAARRADADVRPAQLRHCLRGFLLHGLLPLPALRWLLQPQHQQQHEQQQQQEDPDLTLQLLERLGLCYRVRPGRGAGGAALGSPAGSAGPAGSAAGTWYRFPWNVRAEAPPAEAWLNSAGLLEQAFVVEQLTIEFRFPLFCPPGLFSRYSARVNPHVVERSDGRHCVCAYRGKVPVTLSVRRRRRGPSWGSDVREGDSSPSKQQQQQHEDEEEEEDEKDSEQPGGEGDCSVAGDVGDGASARSGGPATVCIASHATLANVWTAWQAVLPLVEELSALLQEWPGVHYTLHVLCAKCLRRGCPDPHAFPGELLSQPRPEGVTELVCPRGGTGSERVHVSLVYPPSPISLKPCPPAPCSLPLPPSPSPGPSPSPSPTAPGGPHTLPAATATTSPGSSLSLSLTSVSSPSSLESRPASKPPSPSPSPSPSPATRAGTPADRHAGSPPNPPNLESLSSTETLHARLYPSAVMTTPKPGATCCPQDGQPGGAARARPHPPSKPSIVTHIGTHPVRRPHAADGRPAAGTAAAAAHARAAGLASAPGMASRPRLVAPHRRQHGAGVVSRTTRPQGRASHSSAPHSPTEPLPPACAQPRSLSWPTVHGAAAAVTSATSTLAPNPTATSRPHLRNGARPGPPAK